MIIRVQCKLKLDTIKVIFCFNLTLAVSNSVGYEFGETGINTACTLYLYSHVYLYLCIPIPIPIEFPENKKLGFLRLPQSQHKNVNNTVCALLETLST